MLPIDVHRPHAATRQVTDPAKVAKIVGWFDALPTAPHRVLYCPAFPHRPPTTLEFRNGNGAVIARARTPSSEACGFSFNFGVLGSAQKPVLVPRFLLRVGRLLHMRLVPLTLARS
ncbi:MAG TPA: hypothetical protein VF124_09595 [Gaiellaceae bacterium]